LTEREPELAELTLKLTAAEQSYQFVNESFEEARLAESKATSEVTILYAAQPPLAPISPIKVVHVSVTLLLSAVCAIGLALLAGFFDTRLRTIEDAEEALGIPVLATIPAVDGGRVDNLKPISPY
jgi:capsular polysaccharide biosynthesis protein